MEDVVDFDGLHTGLSRLGSAESLLSPARACLAFSMAELSTRGEAGRHLEPLWTGWIGPTPPWPLRPLRWLFTATRRLSLVRDRGAVVAFSQALLESGRDSDFLDLWLVPRLMVERVVSHMREGGSDPEQVLLTEPSCAVLQIQTMAEIAPDIRWALTVRYWADCPADLVAALEAFDDDGDEDQPEDGAGGPTRG